MSFRNIFTISKKELRSYFDSPLAYIVLIVFLFLWEFLFFRGVFLVGRASLTQLFALFPWLGLLLLPSLTMGSISEEKGRGTIEFLLTQPISEQDIILGKFLGCLMFVSVALLLTLPVGFSLEMFGDLDWGVVLAQYLAALLFSGSVGALGIFVSSLFRSQIVSLVLTVVSVFLLLLMGTELVSLSLPFILGTWLRNLSLTEHFNNMIRGVVDFRDLWYFLSFPFLFLFLASFWLKKIRVSKIFSQKPVLRFGVFLLILFLLVSNALGYYIPGRLDLTQNRAFTLSKTTKDLLSGLKESVEITLFASKKLPPIFSEVLRETKDILADYQRLSANKIKVDYKDPSSDPQIAAKVKQIGIPEIQFNVIAREEFKVKKGYLGLAVQLKKAATSSQPKIIPFIRSTQSLEYQLSSFIQELTTQKKKKIVFLVGEGEKTPDYGYQILTSELKKQFSVASFALRDGSSQIPTSTAVLVIGGPTGKFTTSSLEAIARYLDNGGSALFLLDGFEVNPQDFSVNENKSNIFSFLEDYGIEVQKDIVYDLQSNTNVRFVNQFFTLLIPYPFWPQGLAKEEDPLSLRVESIVFPWPSSIRVVDQVLSEKGLTAKTIFQTSKAGASQRQVFMLDPQKPPTPSKVKLRHLALVVKVTERDPKKQSQARRFLVIGDSDFLSDKFVQEYPENLTFGMEAIAWLAQEDSLASLRLKSQRSAPLLFDNPTQKQMIKYGNLGFIFFAPLGLAGWRFWRRRHLLKMRYE